MNGYRSGRVRRGDAYPPVREDAIPAEEPREEAQEPPRYETEPAPHRAVPTPRDEAPAEEAAAGRQEPLPGPRRRRAAEPEEEEDDGEEAQVLATNRTVMLCCTMAAMLSFLAAFLLYAERKSRAIRHNSVQSAALGLVHIIGGLCCLLLGSLLGNVPGLGTGVSLICLLCYSALLVTVTCLRLKLMLHAWRGLRYDLPLIGWALERFV